MIPRHAIGPYGDCKDWCERCRRAREIGIPMDADDLDFLSADTACTWRGKVFAGLDGDCADGGPDGRTAMGLTLDGVRAWCEGVGVSGPAVEDVAWLLQGEGASDV